MRLKNFFFGTLPWLAYSALVLRASTAPPENLPPVLFQVNDKVMHFLEFFLLFWLTVNAFEKSCHAFAARRPILLSLIYGAGMGIITEFLQNFSPGRSPDALDFAADFAACLAGAAIHRFLFERWRKKTI